MNITNEDNMLLMARYPDNYFDLAIVDPPYGIKNNFSRGNPSTKKWSNPKNGKHSIKYWDKSIPNEEYFNELFRVSKNQIIWGGNYMTEFLPPKMGWIFWDKKNGDNEYSDGELAWTSFNKALRKFEWLWNGFQQKIIENRIHPTQKPAALYKWLLDKYAKQGDKILDTHLGSGSIAIACHDYGFDLTACELDKEYFDKAMQRINNHMAQTKLFT
jgi:site-specific DNA-methyltransferase (adenine-specific)